MIPMSIDEEVYVVEKARQEQAGMPACRCSNCEPEACRLLAANGKWLTLSNFDTCLANPEALSDFEREKANKDDIRLVLDDIDNPDAPIVNQKSKGPPARRLELEPLAELMSLTMQNHHEALMENQDRLKAADYLDDDDIWRILNKIYTIDTQDDIYQILGCDILPGGIVKLFECIKDWKADSVGVQAMAKLRSREDATRTLQAETLDRLQKQHDERATQVHNERTRRESKQKEKQFNRLAESAAKRQRKEKSELKKIAEEKLKFKKDEDRARNVRMMSSLRAGKSM